MFLFRARDRGGRRSSPLRVRREREGPPPSTERHRSLDLSPRWSLLTDLVGRTDESQNCPTTPNLPRGSSTLSRTGVCTEVEGRGSGLVEPRLYESGCLGTHRPSDSSDVSYTVHGSQDDSSRRSMPTERGTRSQSWSGPCPLCVFIVYHSSTRLLRPVRCVSCRWDPGISSLPVPGPSRVVSNRGPDTINLTGTSLRKRVSVY